MRRVVTSVDLNADDRRRIDEEWPEEADECRVSVEDGWLCASYVKTSKRFERIRRITGYLVGDMTRWNDAKRAEERDRVKHLSTTEGTEGTEEVSPCSPCSPVGERTEEYGEHEKEVSVCSVCSVVEDARRLKFYEGMRNLVAFLLCMGGLAALAIWGPRR